MPNYKNLTMRYLDGEGIKYTDPGENRLRIVYTGDNLKSIPVLVVFDKDGDPLVQFFCFEICNYKGKEDKGIQVCNEMNNKYRWVKYYVDSDSDIVCTIDAHIDSLSCGEEVLELVRRVVNITDEAYPSFMRGLWS